MKVILQQNIPTLGDAGEIKNVAAGYAVNYLIPKKLVIPATASSKKQLQHQQRLIKLKTDKRMVSLTGLRGKIDGQSLDIKVKAGKNNKLFGSVTAMDISKALAEMGFSVEKRKIEVGKPIKEIGLKHITIKLASNILAKIKVNVIPDIVKGEQELNDKEEISGLSPDQEEVDGSEEVEQGSEAEKNLADSQPKSDKADKEKEDAAIES